MYGGGCRGLYVAVCTVYLCAHFMVTPSSFVAFTMSAYWFLNAPSLAEICLKAPSERLVTKWRQLHPSISRRLTGGEDEGGFGVGRAV